MEPADARQPSKATLNRWKKHGIPTMASPRTVLARRHYTNLKSSIESGTGTVIKGLLDVKKTFVEELHGMEKRLMHGISTDKLQADTPKLQANPSDATYDGSTGGTTDGSAGQGSGSSADKPMETMTESTTKPTAEPMTESTAELTVEPTAESIAELAVEPMRSQQQGGGSLDEADDEMQGTQNEANTGWEPCYGIARLGIEELIKFCKGEVASAMAAAAL